MSDMPISNFINSLTYDIDEDALSTTTSGESLVNYALLITAGDLSDGIYAGADDAAVVNFGQIETSGLGAAGVFVEGNDARIDNRGFVTTRGDIFDPDPELDGDEFFSEGLTAIGDRFQIDNLGLVRVEGEESSGISGIGADGVIHNYIRVEGAGHGSSLVAVFGDGSQAINNGLVTTASEGNAGMLAFGEEASAINYGCVDMRAARSVGMEGVIADTIVSNFGTIFIYGDAGIGVCGIGDGHVLINTGTIDIRGYFSIGMEASGIEDFGLPGAGATIVNEGRILTSGDLAIGVTLGLTNADPSPGFAPASDGEIVNHGLIQTSGDGAAGVAMVGDGHQLINHGRIVTDGGEVLDGPFGSFRAAGVVVSGSDTLVSNASSGIIASNDAASAAVELNLLERDGFDVESATSRFENDGLVKGDVLGGAGQETVVNHGRIQGDVVLGDGANTFVFATGGRLSGNLFLGNGADLVVVESGAGNVRIADFAAGASGADVIDVSALFSSFGALATKSAQLGADVVITLDTEDSLVLLNTTLGALSAADFVFA